MAKYVELGFSIQVTTGVDGCVRLSSPAVSAGYRSVVASRRLGLGCGVGLTGASRKARIFVSGLIFSPTMQGSFPLWLELDHRTKTRVVEGRQCLHSSSASATSWNSRATRTKSTLLYLEKKIEMTSCRAKVRGYFPKGIIENSLAGICVILGIDNH